MPLFRSLLLVGLLLTLATRGAAAQTTRPAPDAWSQSVQKFAQAIIEADTVALVALVAEDVEIEALDSKADAVRLLARTRNGIAVTSLGYLHPPQTLAEDLSAAFKAAGLPEDVKKHMILKDPEHVRRANAIAAEWIGEMLRTSAGDLVGVITLWREGKIAEGEISELVIVLVRAEMVGGKPRIKRIVFGNPGTR